MRRQRQNAELTAFFDSLLPGEGPNALLSVNGLHWRAFPRFFPRIGGSEGDERGNVRKPENGKEG